MNVDYHFSFNKLYFSEWSKAIIMKQFFCIDTDKSYQIEKERITPHHN